LGLEKSVELWQSFVAKQKPGQLQRNYDSTTNCPFCNHQFLVNPDPFLQRISSGHRTGTRSPAFTGQTEETAGFRAAGKAGGRLSPPKWAGLAGYREQVLSARAYNQTEDFTQDMKLRPRIERVIFELTHYNGARLTPSGAPRVCRRRGMDNADWQARMCATAYNLKLWVCKAALSTAA